MSFSSKKILIAFSFVALCTFGAGTLLPHAALADNYGLKTTAREAKLDTTGSVPGLIGNVIGAALSMISVIFFVLMVYGGFLWMTARGDSEQVNQAKETIIAAAIGIIVVLASYAITNFVFNSTENQTSNGGGGENPPLAAGGAVPNNGVIPVCPTGNDSECSVAGQICVSGVCQAPAASSQACEEDSDCASDVCLPENHVCV